MNAAEFNDSLAEAWALVQPRAARWLGCAALLLLAVEVLMFIPGVGFVLKMAVAGVLSAGFLKLLADADSLRLVPLPWRIFDAFSWPGATQVVLALSTLLPFLTGLLFLGWAGGEDDVRFFFSDLATLEPPSAGLFFAFKLVMQAAALPLALVASAVVLGRQQGVAALQAGWAAVRRHPLPVLALGAMAVAYEALSMLLPLWLPEVLAALISLALLLPYVLGMLAVTYTVSKRIFRADGQAGPQGDALGSGATDGAREGSSPEQGPP